MRLNDALFADNGGCGYASDSADVVVEHATFTQCVATGNYPDGVRARPPRESRPVGCDLVARVAVSQYGGALCLYDSSSATISNATFQHTSASYVSARPSAARITPRWM